MCVLGFTPEVEHELIAKAFAISSREPYESVAAIVDCLQHFHLLWLKNKVFVVDTRQSVHQRNLTDY